ncbi:Endonuclease/exonuclease/phosphatase [Chlamydoabsidia padenii]|nr:Endonuclease/exonuclease/phosphatase [Chlamydoabsidia padenii]
MTTTHKQDYTKQLTSLLNTEDKLDICVRVYLQETDKQQQQSKEYCLALIKHKENKDSSSTTSCLILFEKQVSLVPINLIPVTQDTKIDIAQANPVNKNAQPDLLVKISLQEQSINIIFPDKDDMSAFLLKLRESITSSTGSADSDHQWINVYVNMKALGNPTRQQTSLSLNAKNSPGKSRESAISHVLPLQRAQTIANIQLRRTMTAASTVKKRMIESNNAKKHWVNARLQDQEDSFVNWENSKLFVGTWNVHGSLPTESLSTWLLGASKDDGSNTIEPDFYVIGLQEMETNTEAYLYHDPTKENIWVQAVLNGLGQKKNGYYKVASLQLVTMLIIVIAKTEHQPFISEVESRNCGVGLMNMMGNKGGCSVRFRYHDSYFCFVTSHLAAFVANSERRNQDFTEIAKRLVFTQQSDKLTEYVSHSWNSGGDEGVAYLEHKGVTYDWETQASIFHADHVIWMGDLNYRINMAEPEIKMKLTQGLQQELLEYDQLSVERQAGRTFPMFDEGPIHFSPTYKYDAGTNQYDTSTKRRAPSWTDRILWKKPLDQKKTILKLLSYDNCMEMMLSDHKPVQALFDAKVRHIDRKKQIDTRQSLMRQLIETKDNLTKGQISTSFIEFGDVQFMEYKEKTIVLENTGQVVAPFCFISKMDETQICPPWLQITPEQGVLGPGEKVVIQFELMIDASISAPFNEGKQEINDILVLRLENGKDFFIVVSGKYIRTCFGVPLDSLAQMTIPIQEVVGSSSLSNGSSRRNNNGKSTTSDPTNQQVQQQANLPKELWRILTFLWNKNMLSMENLFLDHGDRVVSDYIRKCLDSGDSFDTSILLGEIADGPDEKQDTDDSVGANSMIDVLLAFLECLPEPVIPTSLYSRVLAASDSDDQVKLLKDNLPHLNLNVLLYITSFLTDAIRYSPSTCKQERTQQIVTAFTVLLRPDPEFKETNPALAMVKKEKFISRLLHL